MADHNILEEDVNQYDPIEHWTCSECLKPISASRPPVYNSDNCCCSELGTYTNGGGTQTTQQYTTSNSPQYEPVAYEYTRVPYKYGPSQTTSSSSAQYTYEGLKTSASDSNTYPPLLPESRLNDTAPRYLTPTHTEMSYPMQLFLGEDDVPQPQTNGTSPPKFLTETSHIQHHHSSIKAHKGSKRSEPSVQSSESGGDANGNGIFASCELDPLTGAGAWIDEGYPGLVGGMGG